jgi:hypothetical protein
MLFDAFFQKQNLKWFNISTHGIVPSSPIQQGTLCTGVGLAAHIPSRLGY